MDQYSRNTEYQEVLTVYKVENYSIPKITTIFNAKKIPIMK